MKTPLGEPSTQPSVAEDSLPPTATGAVDAEALIEEARRRQRKRRLVVAWVILVVALAAVGVHLAASPGRSRPAARPAGPVSGEPPGQAQNAVVPVEPGPLAVTGAGQLLVADEARNKILRRTTTGSFVVVAGNGHSGFSGDGGPATRAELAHPQGMAVAPNGTIYVADSGNDRVRAVLPDGTITTVVGDGRQPAGPQGTPTGGLPATTTGVGQVWAVALGPHGSLYVAASNAVVKLEPNGTLNVVLDAANLDGFDSKFPLDGACMPVSLVVGRSGALYVGCSDPFAVIERTPAGQLRFLGMSRPHDAFAAMVADPAGGVLAVNGAAIVHLGSTPTAPVANFLAYQLPGGGHFWPQGIAVGPSGTLFVDQDGVAGIGPPVIAERSPTGVLSVLWRKTPTATAATPVPTSPGPLAYGPNGVLYIADPGLNEVWERLPNGSFEVVAGTGTSGFSGDGGSATQAELDSPEGLLYSHGILYIADAGNHRVQAVLPNKTITTVAGNGGTVGSAAAGGPALDTAIGDPAALAAGPGGAIFIATANEVIDLHGHTVSVLLDGQSFLGVDPGDPNSTDCHPTSLASNSAGDLYVLCTGFPNGLFERHSNGRLVYLAQFPTNDPYAALTETPTGTVLGAQVGSVVSITGATITSVERFSSLPGVGSFSPDAITVSAAGTIYVDQHPGVGSGPPAVVAFTAGSTPTVLWHS